MIDNLSVDGFRSLLSFSISLDKGLNIIVGANGTGKSNFISFIDFLNVFLDDDLNSAIASAQGAGSVFSKEKFGEEEAVLSFSARGSWSPDDIVAVHPHYKHTLNEDAVFNYYCEIRYSRAISTVFIASEEIKISFSQKESMKLARRTDRVNGLFENTVTLDGDAYVFDKFRDYYPKIEGISMESFLSERIDFDRSLLNVTRHMNGNLYYSTLILSQFRSVNIDPTLARRPTPVGSGLELLPTGEGLAGALYQLRKGTYYPTMTRYSGFFAQDQDINIFSSIVSWCREVNPSIENIEVDLDFFEAEFKPFLRFGFSGKETLFPFNRISEGTVKWLALVTMLFSEPHLNIIEEPENFLHPFMQQAFVKLCREIIERHPARTIILSTHSPTLLDCCDPKELTIFEVEEGQTRATRVANRSELQKKIASSRFGLGHYYRTGALYGEDSSIS